MGFYENHILPRFIDWGMSGERFSRLRRKYLEGVSGDVLEVGFGSGLNLPFYTPAVTRLYAVDPSLLGRRLAARRIRQAHFPVEFVELQDSRINLPDQSVDNAVSTWTLCTIPDPKTALAEIRRVLKPGGRLFFLEHGLSPEPGVARWQNLWNPIQMKLAGGCHVNRKMDGLIEEAGFRFIKIDEFYMEGPKLFCYLWGGVAL